jgi:DNA (cytosine-5)-methyltransferase 1
MKRAGYQVRARLLNAMFFGAAQTRQRIIFIGVRNDLGIEPTHPKAQSAPRSVREALRLVGEGGIRSDNQYHKKDPWRSLDLPCRAITRHPPILLLDGNVRKLTVEECGVLSGFPRSWRWGKGAYQLVANAVPPPFMACLAAHVRDSILKVVNIKYQASNE